MYPYSILKLSGKNVLLKKYLTLINETGSAEGIKR